MSLTGYLADRIAAGVRRVGEISIVAEEGRAPYRLCHHADLAAADDPDGTGLEVIDGPERARDLSTWSDGGEFRFLKAAPNLRRGWLMRLRDAEELRLALDGFYPAAIGLWRAAGDGSLRVQHLREKLSRQTGMYRFARNISDHGARQVVAETCDPARHCARRILWQIDEGTPLEAGATRAFDGHPPGVPAAEAIPLLCREPCNHLVACCRERSKAEHAAAAGQSPSPPVDSH